MVDPTQVTELYKAAVREHRTGNVAAAKAIYADIVAMHPLHADALHMLGVIAQGEGQMEEACDLMRRAIAIAPAQAQFRNNLGVALRATGQAQAAAEAFRKAIALDPRSADAQGNLGNALFDLGDTDGAISAYTRALASAPKSVACRNGLAAAYRRAGDLPQSIAIYESLVSDRPADAGALNNLGVVRMEIGDVTGAIFCYQKALEIDPNNLKTLNNISVVFLAEGNALQAELVLRKALSLAPKSATVLGNLGNALRRQGKTVAAAARYREAFSVRPSDGLKVRLATLLPVIAESREALRSARRRMEEAVDTLLNESIEIADPIGEVGATNFHLSYHDTNNKHLNMKVGQLFRQSCPILNFVAPHCRQAWHPAGRKLKVGFISRNLRNHAVGWCYQRLICGLPKDSFDIVVFSLHQERDSVWDAISGAAGKAVTVPANLQAAQARVSKEALDVLIYTDIGLDPITYFLAFARLAPVQCVTNGHPDTTGIPTIDYFLGSGPLEGQDAPNHYSEQLVAFDDVLVDYERPARPTPFRSREAFGLPVDATLYICPQSLFKIHPDMDAALARILEDDENGRLLVFAGPEPHWWQALRQRWEGSFLKNIERVQLIERQNYTDFLNILGLADVVLDTWPFSGGNTAYQAFAMGKPVVTMPGRFARGRSTAALYRRMDFDLLLADTPEDYARRAVRLGTEKAWRTQVAAVIEARADRLFGEGAAANALAEFLRSLNGESEAVA